jgi:hypothetical protein
MQFQPLSGDLGASNAAESAILVWRLVGQRAAVKCSITRLEHEIVLDVDHAGRRLTRERWPDVHTALARAWDVRRELMALGWTAENV